LNKIDEVTSVCKNHKVKKLSVFGSVCTPQFNSTSDIDFLISFQQEYFDGYSENITNLQNELEQLLKHPVDLVIEQTLKNPYFISSTLKTKVAIYE
jgi:predicted nucleotidyltransferase